MAIDWVRTVALGWRWTIAGLVAAGLLVGTGQASTSDERQRTLVSGGLNRTYIEIVPDACRRVRARCAVVFGFHGGGVPGVSGAQFDRQAGLGREARRRGFIAVLPDAHGRNWNDGRSGVEARADDVGFVRAILAAMERNGPGFDGRRVFAMGISNGGHLSFRLACEMADRFAAVAPVVASLSTDLARQCAPSRPIGLLNIVGSADPILPYAGGPMAGGRGRVLSSDRSIAFWAKANRCTTRQPARRIDRVPDDRTALRIDRYTGCAVGGAVERRTIEGGGHVWPGDVSTGIVARISGRGTREMAATADILDFFGLSVPAGR